MPSWFLHHRRWLIASLVSGVTLGSGLVNLVSVLGGPTHPAFLREIFPIEFIHVSRNITLLCGFALVVSSLNIYRRKRRAWWIVLALSATSIVFHLTKGLDYEEAAASTVLLIALLLTRRTFSVRSSTPDLRTAIFRIAISIVIVVSYGVAGFWLLDQRHFGINFHIGQSIVAALRFFSLNPDPQLVPHTGYAHWFLRSLYLIAATGIIYAGFAVFQPVIYRFATLPRERQLARAIVAQFARTSQDFFKLWPDKAYFFSPTRRCFLAYRVSGHAALALGDPVGPESEIETTARAFLDFCHDNGWTAGLHQTLPDFLPLYKALGLKKLKIGDDALVDVRNFSLEGKSRKEFRYKVRQLEALNIVTEEFLPPVPASILAELRQVSDEWLQIPGRRERTFTLGQFDHNYVRSTPVLAAREKQGGILAFVNLITLPPLKELSVDLMRRRTQAPNGIMDYLFVKLFLYARDHGFERCNLGMAPMAGFHEREEASPEERAIHGFFQQLNFLFSFRGLRQYKAKFATSWEPRYLVYRNPLDLPRLALALRRISELRQEDEAEETGGGFE